MTDSHTPPEPGQIWGESSPEYEPKDRFVCPECGNDLTGDYLRWHLVKKHGWTWWDDENVQKLFQPAPPQQGERVETKPFSDCCGDSMSIGGDDTEGTHYYVCNNCGNPCDPVQPSPPVAEPPSDENGNLSPEVRKLVNDNFKDLIWRDGQPLPQGEAELRQSLADVIFGHDGCSVGAPANTTKMLDALVHLIAQRDAGVATDTLEKFRVFCYEKEAFAAWDTPESNRQGWLDTKLREFAKRLATPTDGGTDNKMEKEG